MTCCRFCVFVGQDGTARDDGLNGVAMGSDGSSVLIGEAKGWFLAAHTVSVSRPEEWDGRADAPMFFSGYY